MTDELRIATDPTTGRPILVAPKRRHRPLHTHGKASGPCPFCPGEEHQTPPEIDAVRDHGGPNEPGWRVRAFSNLYPASNAHEVVVEGAAHETRPSQVDAATWNDAFALYRRRIAAIEQRPDIEIGFLFKNVGREAGASIEHNHSQLIGLPMLPPRLALELECARSGCPHCEDLAAAEREDRIILETENHVALSPRHPKLPNETWVLPREHDADFLRPGDNEASDLATLMTTLYGAIDRAFDSCAFNVYLHRVPNADFHWHLELQPRTGFLAGLELGGDMYINSISGAEAAAQLRRHC